MSKKGLTQIQKVGLGSIFGFTGIIMMSFGSMTSPMLLRIGIIVTSIGGWLITW